MSVDKNNIKDWSCCCFIFNIIFKQTWLFCIVNNLNQMILPTKPHKEQVIGQHKELRHHHHLWTQHYCTANRIRIPQVLQQRKRQPKQTQPTCLVEIICNQVFSIQVQTSVYRHTLYILIFVNTSVNSVNTEYLLPDINILFYSLRLILFQDTHYKIVS